MVRLTGMRFEFDEAGSGIFYSTLKTMCEIVSHSRDNVEIRLHSSNFSENLKTGHISYDQLYIQVKEDEEVAAEICAFKSGKHYIAEIKSHSPLDLTSEELELIGEKTGYKGKGYSFPIGWYSTD